jgi:hypothetical protein
MGLERVAPERARESQPKRAIKIRRLLVSKPFAL